MRMPNSFGSVYKLPGKRRRPYIARKTMGYTAEGQQIKKIIGYSETKQGAIQLLADYNNNPFDVDIAGISVIRLFDQWLPWKIKTSDISQKSISRYNNAIKYYKDVYSIKFTDLTYSVLQNIIDNCSHGYATKSDIKVLYSQLFAYGKQIGLPLKKNASEGIFIGKKEKSTLHIPFSEEEIDLLWSNSSDNFIKLILIDIYTGFRPKELLNPTEINLDQEYIIAGCKTDAGIDRIVPIHKKIYQFVKDILVDTKMSYVSYNRKFSDTMRKLNLNHTPYDCRHTFATRADNYGLNKLCIKKIMGHSIQDITDGTYTHKTFEQLKEEINKIL